MGKLYTVGKDKKKKDKNDLHDEVAKSRATNGLETWRKCPKTVHMAAHVACGDFPFLQSLPPTVRCPWQATPHPELED